MRRRTLDALLTTGGLIVAVVLLVAGGLLTWASKFVDDNVRTQLSAQQIFFPPFTRAGHVGARRRILLILRRGCRYTVRL